jgi:hypothetical protein
VSAHRGRSVIDHGVQDRVLECRIQEESAEDVERNQKVMSDLFFGHDLVGIKPLTIDLDDSGFLDGEVDRKTCVGTPFGLHRVLGQRRFRRRDCS